MSRHIIAVFAFYDWRKTMKKTLIFNHPLSFEAEKYFLKGRVPQKDEPIWNIADNHKINIKSVFLQMWIIFSNFNF